MINLSDTLALLSEQRPIFHSEADFQYALAWLIHLRHPDAQIRLEYRLFGKEPFYLDLWIVNDERAVAIELKYKTRRVEVVSAGEQFFAKNQAAQDITRYDFIKDITRLERSVLDRPGMTGYGVLLTNDSSYWTTSARTDTVDAAFRFHEGARLSGSLAWAAHASAGTMEGREAPLDLRGSYQMSWHDYSTVDTRPSEGRFRYLLVRVDPEGL
jgi:hypothetical protein